MKYLLASLIFITTSAVAMPEKIILFRHGEKLAGINPGLTLKGHNRAKWIAKEFGKSEIKHLFSTDYNRTKQTITPLSQSIAVEYEIYNPRELTKFAEKLMKLTGNVIVLGHSNTTPKLAGLLTGKAFPKLSETEFSQYYVVEVDKSGYKAERKTMPSIVKD